MRREWSGFFFFKQNTAYEFSTWLEFRRVLFRSVAVITTERAFARFGRFRPWLPSTVTASPAFSTFRDRKSVVEGKTSDVGGGGGARRRNREARVETLGWSGGEGGWRGEYAEFAV